MLAFGARISKGAKNFLNSNCLRSAFHSRHDKSKRSRHSEMTAWRKTAATRRGASSLKASCGAHERLLTCCSSSEGKNKAQLQLFCYQPAYNRMCWATHTDRIRKSFYNTRLSWFVRTVIRGNAAHHHPAGLWKIT